MRHLQGSLPGRHVRAAVYGVVEGSAGYRDGTGVVSHVGAALLRMPADRAGLTQALSAGLGRHYRWPVHDRGRSWSTWP